MTKRSGKEEVIWTKAFTNIFIVNFVMSMGQFMMVTLVPKYTYELGGTPTVVGMVTGIFAVTALGIRPFAGPAIDYFKKNRLLSIAIAIMTLSFVFYGFAQNITMLIIARLIHGLGMGVSAPLSLALVSNTLPNGKIASGLGLFSLGGAISTAVGPTVGLKLADAIGYNQTFFICTGLMFLCFMLTLTLKADIPVRPEHFKISLKQVIAPEALLPTGVLFLQILSYSCINSFIAIFGGLNNVTEIGLFFTANAICLIFLRPLSGKIADKYGVDKTVVPGFLIFIVALLFISFSRSLPMFIVAGVLTAFGFGISEPIVQTMNMQLVPKERRGAASNTNFMGIDIAMLIGPTLAGFIITQVQNTTGNQLTGFSVMYKVMIIPTVIALILFIANRKKLLGRIKAVRQAEDGILQTPSAELEAAVQSD